MKFRVLEVDELDAHRRYQIVVRADVAGRENSNSLGASKQQVSQAWRGTEIAHDDDAMVRVAGEQVRSGTRPAVKVSPALSAAKPSVPHAVAG